MQTNDEIKSMVREKYATIALEDKSKNSSSCCGSGSCSTEVYNIMNDEYAHLEGYNPDADLGLGCGLPTEFALIKEGDVVVDLGSGAGNDAFVARAITGSTGKVMGIDFTEAMIEKARANADKLGYNNVEFRLGDIEDIPMNSMSADVVVSNCVMNLVPDKNKAYSEVFRILKEGGHFSISDIVLNGALPEKIKNAAEMYAGCVASAIQKKFYLESIQQAGFVNIAIQKQKLIVVPDDILRDYLNEDEIAEYKASVNTIESITVYAEKPKVCCTPKQNCC